MAANSQGHIPNVSTPLQPNSRPPPLLINQGEDDEMQIEGYKRSIPRTILAWAGILLTLGMLRLVFHWKQHWMLVSTHISCSLEEASKVLLRDQYNQQFVAPIQKVIRLDSQQGDRNSYHCSYQALDRRTNHQHCSSSPIMPADSPDLEAGDLEDHPLVIPSEGGAFLPAAYFTYFEIKKVRYLWNQEKKQFIRLSGLDYCVESSFYYNQTGLRPDEQAKRRILYGENAIEVQVQSYGHILFQEVLGPFYVFQAFSIVLWTIESYYYYAICIVIMSALSLISSVLQIRRNQQQLHDTVQGVDTVTVVKAGGEQTEVIQSTQLVPGDVIVIPQYGGTLQCDSVLISGNVIVNESMLTGESVPVTKTPLPNQAGLVFCPKEHGKHVIYSGTKVIQTRNYMNNDVRAVVIRTGFLTTKGELVRSIMFPKPVDWKLNRHIHKFIGFLAILAMGGFIYTVILKYRRGVHYTEILLKAADLITIIIPPALPAAMTIGIIVAQSRLKRHSIFCISPRSINLSGCINCVCFDKTGTLTEDDLSFSHVVPVKRSNLTFEHDVENVTDLPTDELVVCMATCHSLTRVSGNLIGDPLDYKMFESTGWILEEPEVDDTVKFDLLAPTIVKKNRQADCLSCDPGLEVGILRQFTFSSSLQRMSVVTRKLGDSHFELYLKGAPEMVESLCIPTTIPNDFHTKLGQLTQRGLRVIGLSYRKIDMNYKNMQKARREDLELDLTFLGFLVMGNMLKPVSIPIMKTLMDANIRPIMVTGDNMLTALSVARECRMIAPEDKVILLSLAEESHTGTPVHEKVTQQPTLAWRWADPAGLTDEEYLQSSADATLNEYYDDYNSSGKVKLPIEPKIHVAVTGKTFRVLRDDHPDLYERVCVRGTIFSRMAPDQKQQLIEDLQGLGYFVAMCGDGANDCGALKAAHAGISLSEAEASVASPFTSKTPDISCVPTLIKEGRASLVTSFGILKYMAGYSITQFASVIVLYTVWTNLTDWQFLYQDLFLITLFAALFGRNEPYPHLARKPPPSTLIGLTPLASISLQALLVISFQLAAVVLLRFQPWYVPHKPLDEDHLASHDNYAIFAVSVFQYITLAVVFSKGSPYREPIYTNYWLMVSLVVMTILTIYLVMIPFSWLANAFELDIDAVTYEFRAAMVLLALIHFLLAFLVESWLVDHIIFHKVNEILRWFGLQRTPHPYERLDIETRSEGVDWLPGSLVSDLNLKTHHSHSSYHSQGIKSNGTAAGGSSAGNRRDSSHSQSSLKNGPTKRTSSSSTSGRPSSQGVDQIVFKI